MIKSLSRRFPALVLAGATMLAHDSNAQAPVALPDIPFSKYVLGNGLTLIVHEDHKAPIVAVNVWYHVGSKNEKAGKTGFAHLFEHLMFNGSENFNQDYLKEVEAIGATDLNGTTNEDRTNYFQSVPLSSLDRVLWLESDRMGHLLGAIDQARLDEQRGVVQNEKRQSENEPYGKSWITVAENTFPRGHPYSWSVIGSMEDLGAASLDDVKEWFRTYYGPSNAVLVIAGDITAADAKARVEKYFGDIPPGPPIARHAQWIARRTGTQRQAMQDRVPQARIIKVWNVPQFSDLRIVPLEMAQDILATGKTSRLFKRLVYTDRIATSVQGFIDAREIAGQLWLMADVQPGGDTRKVEAALDEEVARFLKDGPTDAEVEEARVRFRANFVRGVERIGGFGGKSDVLAQGEIFGGDPQLVRRKIAHSQQMTARDIATAARDWLSDGQYVLEVQPFPEFVAATAGADRKKIPEVGAPPAAAFPARERATLSNGLKIELARRSTVPVVELALVLDAGYAADRFATPGTANLAMAMVDEGTATRTSEQISTQLAALGATLTTGSSLDASTVRLNALRDKLDPALDIWADVILNPSFPQGDLDRLKRTVTAGIQQEKVQPISMLLRVLPTLTYGTDHAYGMPLTGSGSEETVKDMTREALQKFHLSWFHPNNATLLVVGDITMDELKARIERVLGSWKPADVPKKTIATVAPKKGAEVYILDRPGAEQTLVAAAQLIPPKSYAQDIAFQMFNDIFGGSFGSRVNQNLREDKHWTYGAGSLPWDARGQRLWFVYAPVQTDKTKESIQEVVRELREVAASRPVSAAELQEAKDRQTRTLAGRWETGSAVLGDMREMVNFGLPADYYDTFATKVQALTVDDLKKVVADVMRPDREVYVFIGDRAKIEAGIRELNLGPVQLLDADGRPRRITP